MEATKSVDFTIGADAATTTAPVTTHSLTPASPGAGGTYNGPVSVTAVGHRSGVDRRRRRAEDASTSTRLPDHWEPNALTATVGDTVRWNFPAATAGTVRTTCG